MIANQNPEQLVRDQIDRMLLSSGWRVQSRKQINIVAGAGVAFRENQTNIGPADYILFVNKKPVGVIEAKREEEAVRLTMHGEQSVDYATTELKYFDNDSLPFVYESMGDQSVYNFDNRHPNYFSAWPKRLTCTIYKQL